MGDGEGGFRGFMSGVKDAWSKYKTGRGCVKEAEAMYAANEALDSAWTAWDDSLKIDEVLSTGGGNSSYSYTSAYSAETTATFKEECEKITGNTFTSTPDRSFQCRQSEGGNSGQWENVLVDVSKSSTTSSSAPAPSPPSAPPPPPPLPDPGLVIIPEIFSGVFRKLAKITG